MCTCLEAEIWMFYRIYYLVPSVSCFVPSALFSYIHYIHIVSHSTKYTFYRVTNKIIASRLADSVWQPLPKFGESGSRHFKSGSRHLTKDMKTDLKSVRSKLSKTVSFDAVTQNSRFVRYFGVRCLDPDSSNVDGVAKTVSL